MAEEKSKTLLLEAAVAKTRVTCIETQTEQEEEVGNDRDVGGIYVAHEMTHLLAAGASATTTVA